MSDKTTNYQCPACGGPLHFSDATQDLTCDYCDSHYSVEEIEELFSEKDAAAAEAQAQQEAADAASAWELGSETDWDAETEHLRAYNCTGCGAELICDENTAATACPYCGNPTIIPGQLTGMLKPDYVIPFQLDKEAAMNGLRKHYQGKKLLPDAFARENQIGKIQGIYVPFWLFDGRAHADFRFNATRTHVRETRDERITSTEHYNLYRTGDLAFRKIPADASSKMPDDLMDSLEPFDYSQLKPFSTAYLPGFLADKYDVTVEDCSDRADQRAARTAKDVLRSSCIGYDTVTEAGGNVSVQRGKVYYAMLPVWVLNTKWHGRDYLFAMNGQTGKMIGDLPTDKGKYWRYFAIVAAAVTVAGAALMSLL